MDQIKHSKYKNSGILFELLIRQIASDTLSNSDSPAISIVKKYFNKTELSKEYKLYEAVIKSKQLSEGKAEALLSAVLDLSGKLNKQTLRKEKYNLIKEIKHNYSIDDFFKSKVNNYKEYAAVYNLIESRNDDGFINPSQIIQNKHTLLEHITRNPVDQDQVKDQVMTEYLEMDKGSRIVAYKMMLEKFNKKYSTLSNAQKGVLKEYINKDSNTSRLNEYVDEQFRKIKQQLVELNSKVDDQTTKIKLNEIVNLISVTNKNHRVKDEDLINLLHYHQLINELNEVINGK